MNRYQITFREEVKIEDIITVQELVESSGFFYDFEIPIAVELVEQALNDNKDYKFIFADVNGETVAYACYGESSGSVGGYDLYWIVNSHFRNLGIGTMLINQTHKRVQNEGGRFIIAETSSLDKYLPTRNFYEKNGYIKEATIKDYYTIGDDKVVYIKRF
jgi:ribosomal protein S18 acetylase RimI-like enzyme